MSRIKRTSENWSEMELIRAIENRPILYDKTLPEYRKASLTEQAWQDVAKQVNASETDVKKRWKSLRDTFIKYYRLELTQDSPLNSRKKKWKFYDDLHYLRAHCEMYRMDTEGGTQSQTFTQTKSAKREREEYTIPNKSESETEMVLDGAIQVVVEKPNEETDEYTIYEANEDEEEVDENEEDGKEIYIEEQYVQSDTASTQDKKIEILSSRQYTEDPDEKFLLSCLPVLKRLPSRKNAYLKLKIQTLLYDIEFGSPDEPEPRRTKYDY